MSIVLMPETITLTDEFISGHLLPIIVLIIKASDGKTAGHAH